MRLFPDIKFALLGAKSFLLNTGQVVKANKWQGVKAPAPMFEAMDLAIKFPMPQTLEELIADCKPSTPWAEMHFQERIGGIPLNPPPSHEHWPFGVKNNEQFQDGGKFDHTYPERFWPKFANGGFYDEHSEKDIPIYGIRFEYGDLTDVIKQLINDPTTRQAYLPIWFPEDTGAKGGKGRVPCTIGYHFMIRNGYLHLTYWMRSCDYLRHFTDDIYLAIRLAQYVTDELNYVKDLSNPMGFEPLKLGMLKFHAVSFHIFEFERGKL